MTLEDFVSAFNSQQLKVVDLTHTLSPEFPHISLPPEMGQAWPFRIEEASRYDDRGPAWYWNNFSCGEHTGTHFDAPIHWVSGKDLPNNSVDTIQPERFVGAAFVVDCSRESAANADFLLTKPFLLQTYRRDMGGGQFVLMKDLSSPIMIRGKHWGAFRMGFRQS